MRKTRLIKLLSFLIVCCWVVSCKKDLTPVSNQIPGENKAFVDIKVSPDSGTVGTILQITGKKFDPSVSLLSITFNDTEPFRVDSGKGDTIYTYVPFEAQSGKITLDVYEVDTLWVSNDFRVIQQCDTSKICVLEYDLKQPITQKSANNLPDNYNAEAWKAEIVGDTVIISRYIDASEYGITHILSFLCQKNNLPEHLEIKRIVHEDTGTRESTMDRGVIKIQDWDTSGVISGRVIGKLWSGFNYSFRYDFNEQVAGE